MNSQSSGVTIIKSSVTCISTIPGLIECLERNIGLIKSIWTDVTFYMERFDGCAMAHLGAIYDLEYDRTNVLVGVKKWIGIDIQYKGIAHSRWQDCVLDKRGYKFFDTIQQKVVNLYTAHYGCQIKSDDWLKHAQEVLDFLYTLEG